MTIESSLDHYNKLVAPYGAKLVAVSKTKPIEILQQAYNHGQRIFGENKVQELTQKAEVLPKDIEWHMIGHLQSNKVKYIAPFVSLIHAVDSMKLLKEINKQALKNNRTIGVLLQCKIADEDSKFGLKRAEVIQILEAEELKELENIEIRGLMGMATNTPDQEQINTEFKNISILKGELSSSYNGGNTSLQELSIGMSSDFNLALENGSTMIRVGSAIFGKREYTNG